MKPSSPFFIRQLALYAAATLALVAPLSARVGETITQIETRLLADGSAVRVQPGDLASLTPARMGGRGRYFGGGGSGAPRQNPESDGFDITTIDRVLWQAIGQTLPDPDANGVRKRPPDFPETLYFKTDDGSSAALRLKNGDLGTGWEMRVYLYKGVSSLEVYHRIGANLTDAEINALLNSNKGNVAWTQNSGQANSGTGQDASDSFLGYDYERADGALRALHLGNDLVIFSAEMDRTLIKIRDAASKAAVSPAGKNTDAAALTSTSVRGF